MTPAELSRTVVRVVRSAVDEGALSVAGDAVPDVVKVERPRPGGGGDYASGVALKLAAAAGLPPRRVAEVLRRRIADQPGIALVEISGPGFLNITLDRGGKDRVVRRVLEATASYGHGDALLGQSYDFAEVCEERARVVTDVVVRLLRSQGLSPAPSSTGTGASPRRLPRATAPRARRCRCRSLGHAPGRPARSAAYRGRRVARSAGEQCAFRVRYAYARSRALTRNALELGFRGEVGPVPDGEILLGLLSDHPGVLESAARHQAPDRLARQLEAVADELLRFQHGVLPLGDEKPSAAHRNRLALAEAAGTVLAGGLSLLGIDAPEFL